MSEVKTIRLYGVLGSMFGREHKLVVDSPAHAIRALSALIPGFEKFMMTAHLNGLRFAVFKNKVNIGKDEFNFQSGKTEIRIAPIISGSKRAGMFQTIIGAVMVVAGAALSYFSAGTLAAVGVGMMKFGGAMMLGGVIQMIAPQPKGIASRQDTENAPSYAFGGPVNTTAMGNPVGVLYGTREIGGAIVSAGIYTEDITDLSK